MPRLLLALLFLALSVAPAPAEPLAPAELKTVLARIREKRAAAPDLQADFSQHRNIHLLDEPIVSDGRISFQTPNKFRVELKGNTPSMTISDGQQLWIYYPKFKSAEHYSLVRHSPLDAAIAAIMAGLSLQNLESTYHIVGSKQGDNVILELSPRVPSLKRIFQRLELTLDSNLHVTRTDMSQANGDRIVTTYTNQQSAAIPATTFEFTPPPGTDITSPLGK